MLQLVELSRLELLAAFAAAAIAEEPFTADGAFVEAPFLVLLGAQLVELGIANGCRNQIGPIWQV